MIFIVKSSFKTILLTRNKIKIEYLFSPFSLLIQALAKKKIQAKVVICFLLSRPQTASLKGSHLGSAFFPPALLFSFFGEPWCVCPCGYSTRVSLVTIEISGGLKVDRHDDDDNGGRPGSRIWGMKRQ